MVGFQTRLKCGEQKRVFGMIPGLEKAEFARYGVMHRNTYLNGPGHAGPPTYALTTDPLHPLRRTAHRRGGIYGVGGQRPGGRACWLSRRLRGLSEPTLPGTTMLGALVRHTTHEQHPIISP